jgi:hypothetical protein
MPAESKVSFSAFTQKALLHFRALACEQATPQGKQYVVSN